MNIFIVLKKDYRQSFIEKTINDNTSVDFSANYLKPLFSQLQKIFEFHALFLFILQSKLNQFNQTNLNANLTQTELFKKQTIGDVLMLFVSNQTNPLHFWHINY